MKEFILITGLTLTLSSGNVVSQECGAVISGGITPVCYNSSPGELIATGSGSSDYTYQWYAGDEKVEGAVDSVYTPEQMTLTTGFYCEISSEECGTVKTPEMTIVVDPLSVGGIVTGISQVCIGTTGVELTLEGYTGSVVRWQSSADKVVWNDIISDQDKYTTGQLVEAVSYRVIVKSGSCDSAVSVLHRISVRQEPGPAGLLTGPDVFIPGTEDVEYSVEPVTDADTYSWSYSGTGVSIEGNSNEVLLDFSFSATGGELSVSGENICGIGEKALLLLVPADKTLELSDLLLEGLYEGSGIMRASGSAGNPQWDEDIADCIKVELHDASDYGNILFTESEIYLGTDGEASVTIPSEFIASYFVTVKHRNSIEITTADPVSFSQNTIDISFGDPSEVYGGNLKQSPDGYYLVFGGDTNGDGIIDRTGDMDEVAEASMQIMRGYNNEDINGDGLVDTLDMNIIDNNISSGIAAVLP